MNPVAQPSPQCDLTVIIPARNEAENLAELLPQVNAVLDRLAVCYIVLIVDEKADQATRQVAVKHNAALLIPDTQGYGSAIYAGLMHAHSEYALTMDADLSHPPDFICDLWNARSQAEIIIASRYVPGGKARMPFSRLVMSQVLNFFFSRGLGLPVHDMSSGYRMYTTQAVQNQSIEGKDFNILQELLVNAMMNGSRVKEIPFDYMPRRRGSSHARIIKFGLAYLQTFGRLWRKRNSIKDVSSKRNAVSSQER